MGFCLGVTLSDRNRKNEWKFHRNRPWSKRRKHFLFKDKKRDFNSTIEEPTLREQAAHSSISWIIFLPEQSKEIQASDGWDVRLNISFQPWAFWIKTTVSFIKVATQVEFDPQSEPFGFTYCVVHSTHIVSSHLLMQDVIGMSLPKENVSSYLLLLYFLSPSELALPWVGLCFLKPNQQDSTWLSCVSDGIIFFSGNKCTQTLIIYMFRSSHKEKPTLSYVYKNCYKSEVWKWTVSLPLNICICRYWYFLHSWKQ